MVALILGLIVTIALLGAGFVYIKKNAGSGGDQQKEELIKTIKAVDDQLENLAKQSANKASRAQLSSVEQLLSKVQSDLESERANLKVIEEKLAVAQKNVEAKEFQQQELKAAKEDDESKLTEVMEAYADLSRESIELENRVAQSMKNLDKLMSEVNVNDEQKAALENLSETLTSAGSLLRELITEYQTLNERLKLLKSQHSDLEEEYTRLVEQQLGE